MSEIIFASGCLTGLQCRFDGEDKRSSSLLKKIKNKRVIFECPETLGGLPTPRVPSCIIKGDGRDVIAGNASVISERGKDITSHFIRGARKTLEIIKSENIKKAFLKSKSPSCGVHIILRRGKKVKGCGVTAALLQKNGIQVFEL